MKAFGAMLAGIIAILMPLRFLSGLVVVPQYRTGTIADFMPAIVAGAALYGGVLLGVLFGRRLMARPDSFRTTVVAGVAGAMAAITVVIVGSALSDLVTTGRIMPPGHTPALLPILYIVGGVVSAFIAAGAALIGYALRVARG